MRRENGPWFPHLSQKRDSTAAEDSAMEICQGFWYKLSRLSARCCGRGRRYQMPLRRDEIALVVLSLAEGALFTPVQIQKALFLASDKVADAFRRDSRYDFQPYDYGP